MAALIFLSLLIHTSQPARANDFAHDPLFRFAEEAWNNTAVDNARIQILGSETQAGNRLPLTIVIDRRSPWTLDFVTPFIRGAEQLFKQCDLQLNPITVVELEHPRLLDFSSSTDYLVTKDFPQGETHKPLIVFNQGTNGEVYTHVDYYKYHEFEFYSHHTVFIDRLALVFHSSEKDREYFIGSVVTHELLHTLLNEGHNKVPGNVLNNTSTHGFEISADQCRRLLLSPLVKNNLRPRYGSLSNDTSLTEH